MRETAKDRISNLPDSLLHYILSFLHNIKDVARTSVLSKRWNYIWTTVPILDIQSWESCQSPPSSTEIEKFMDFVDGTLQRHNSSNVDKFILKWHHLLNGYRVHLWIAAVIRVPALKLLKIESWDCGTADRLQHCALKIHAPSLLKFTYLASVAKEYDLSTFLTPVEAIVRFSCFENEKDGAEIIRLLRALAHVKCLTVNDLSLQAIAAYNPLNNMLLTFHNVKVLNISDRPTADQGLIALLKSTPELESLVFNQYFIDEEEESSEEDEDSSDEDNENSNDEDVKDNAESDGDDSSEDDDADSVEGENNHEDENQKDVSDAAEGGSKDEGEDNYDNEDDSWALNGMTTGCLFPHLKSVCFQQFGGNPREMRWVKLILRNAEVLEKVTIRYNSYARFVNGKSEEEVMVEIPSIRRASASCVLKFC